MVFSALALPKLGEHDYHACRWGAPSEGGCCTSEGLRLMHQARIQGTEPYRQLADRFSGTNGSVQNSFWHHWCPMGRSHRVRAAVTCRPLLPSHACTRPLSFPCEGTAAVVSSQSPTPMSLQSPGMLSGLCQPASRQGDMGTTAEAAAVLPVTQPLQCTCKHSRRWGRKGPPRAVHKW